MRKGADHKPWSCSTISWKKNWETMLAAVTNPLVVQSSEPKNT